MKIKIKFGAETKRDVADFATDSGGRMGIGDAVVSSISSSWARWALQAGKIGAVGPRMGQAAEGVSPGDVHEAALAGAVGHTTDREVGHGVHGIGEHDARDGVRLGRHDDGAGRTRERCG